jgi:isocitrate dehydrogenase
LFERARLDKNAALEAYCTALERATIKSVEDGFMTKDLAICVYNTMK